MKKIIVACVVLLLVLVAVPSAMAATKSGSCGSNLRWAVSTATGSQEQDNLLTITGSGAMNNYTAGNAPWKDYMSKIRQIVVSDGATSIGNNAFRGMTKLSSFTIADSVTSIGDYAFYGDNYLNMENELPGALVSIGEDAFSESTMYVAEFPNTLKTIGKDAFRGTPQYYVEIPDSVTSIGTGCFAECGSLQTVILPSGLTEIPDEMFKDSYNLTTVSIPNSVTRIGNNAFDSCYVPNLTLPSGLRVIGSEAFSYVSKTTFVLPGSVTTIGSNAFNTYSGYKRKVAIPDSVTSLPTQMFYQYSDVTVMIHSGYAYKSRLQSCCKIVETEASLDFSMIEDFGYVGTGVKYYLTVTGKLVLWGSGDIPAETFKNETRITTVEIQGNNIKNIGASAFEGCTNLTSVTVPSAAVTIRERAFYGCIRLTSFTYSGSASAFRIFADSIGENAFYGCTCLTEIEVDADSIGKYAFANCTELRWASCSNSDADIPEGMFKGCTRLETVYMPKCTTVGPMAFDGCTSLNKCYSYKAYTYYSGYTSIQENAFRGCNALEWFFLPAYVTEIAEDAFPTTTVLLKENSSTADTGNQPAIQVSNAIKEATQITGGGFCGSNAMYYITGQVSTTTATENKKLVITGTGEISGEKFKGNKGFNRLVISEGITGIGYGTFRDTYCCEATLPASLRTIGAQAFRNCTGLDTLNWQSGLTMIGDYAFENNALSTIELPETVVSIGHYAFYKTGATSVIIIPGSVKTIGNYAFTNGSNTSTIVIYSKDSNYIPGPGYTGYNGGTANSITIPVESGISVNDLLEYGKCGTSAYYYVTSGKALYVTGTGAIQDYAFYYMDNSSMTGKVRVSTLGKQLTAVTIGEGITHVGEFCFRCDENIASVVLPESLQSMGREAFSGILYLSSIQFPQHDFTAGDHLFFNAYFNLRSVTLPEGLTKIPASMFSSCKNLTSIYIPSTVTEIETYALSGTGLTSVELPEGLTTIGGAAFYGAPLTKVTLPASLTSMEISAFGNCSSLNRVVFRGSIPEDTLSDTYGTAFESSTANIWVPHGTAVWAEGKLGANNTVHYYCPQDETNMATFAAVSSEQVEPTCTKNGYESYYYCTKCGLIFTDVTASAQASQDDYTIPATGHSYVDEPVLTFAADGSACTAAFACKHGDNTVEVPMTVTSEVETPAGCLTKGKTLYTATLEIDRDVTVDGETVSLPAGTYTKTLLVEDIDALGHDPQPVASVEATCTETGLTEGSVCARCKEVLVPQSVIPATGHSYDDEPVLTFAADGSACTATFTCVHEDHSITVQAKVSSEVSVPAKCLEKGKTLYTAMLEIDGDVTVDGETVSLPDGTYTETLELENIPATGHTEVTIPGIEPTCTEPGTLDYIFCKVCKAVLQEDSEIPPLGHKDAVTIEALQPTCTEAGHTEEHQCSVCHEILTASQTIPATGHHYGEPVFRWSEDGTTCQVSFGCEKEDDTQTMEAEVTSEVTLDPSCTEVGSKVYTATVEFGGKEYSEAGEPVEVPATGHTPVTDAAVAPTDRESGLTEGSHCGVCGASLKGQETIPALWSYSEDGLTAIAYNGTASEVTIPEGVTALGDELFMDNISVTSVLVPKEVTAVGTYTFYGTSGMTDIYLPDNLTGIQATTFFGTTARLHTSAGGSTARQISYRENAFTDGAWTLQFKRMNEPTEIYLLGWEGTDETLVIPESFGGVALKAIRANAFDGMSQVKQITVPESVTEIAEDAFDGCGEDLTLKSAYDAYARTWALANEVKWEHDKHVPQAVEGVPATYTKTGLTEGSVCAECGEVLEEQEEIPALDTSVLKTLKLPTGLTEIEEEAFEKGAFEAVIIPDGCTHIGHKAFKECEQLVYVSYPTGAGFEEDAFVGCGEIEFAER